MITKTPQEENSFYQKLYRSLVSIVLIGILLYWGRPVLVPVAFASLFALLLIPVTRFFEKLGLGSGFSATLSTLLFLVTVTIVSYFVSSQVISFRTEMPRLAALLLERVHELQAWISQKFHVSTASIDEVVHNATSKTLSNSTSIIQTTVGSLSGLIVYMVLVPIFTFLLLFYRGQVLQFFTRIFNEKYTATVREVFDKIQYVIKSYIVGLLIEMIIVATLNCVGFLVLGVKYAFLLGVIAALLNVIPYIGIFAACLLSTLITSATNTPAVVGGVAIVLLLVHLTDANIILPKVVGSKVKINVLATILAVLVGNELWGIPGMFLSIPIVAILKIVFDSVEELKPWGYLIGDEKKAPQPPKIYTKLKKLVKAKNK